MNRLVVPGYRSVCKSRSGRQGGGVALLVKEDIVFNLVEPVVLPLHTSYDGIFIAIPQRAGPDTVVGALYRPSGQSVNDFNDELVILLSNMTKNKGRIMLAGDFNIDLLKINEHGPPKIF